MADRYRYTKPSRAECSLCDYLGPERTRIDAAMADQERHADSPQHQRAILKRDWPGKRPRYGRQGSGTDA